MIRSVAWREQELEGIWSLSAEHRYKVHVYAAEQDFDKIEKIKHEHNFVFSV